MPGIHEGIHRLDLHERIVLQFSGGRDSLGALFACKPWWHKIIVVWGNRGADFPETLETIARVRELPVRFAEVHAPMPMDLSMEVHGLPVDVLPLGNVEDAARLTGRANPGPKMQSFLSCCNRMLFEPLQRFCREYGATMIVRGQRLEETMKSPVRSGDVLDGVEYLFPLERMTEAEVDALIDSHGFALPDHYQYTSKSLDCWSCTAYLHENLDTLEYTKRFHPQYWRKLAPRLQAVQAAVRSETKFLDAAVELAKEPKS